MSTTQVTKAEIKEDLARAEKDPLSHGYPRLRKNGNLLLISAEFVTELSESELMEKYNLLTKEEGEKILRENGYR